ncbi:unnamed protein product, partial [Effrenium voratum]
RLFGMMFALFWQSSAPDRERSLDLMSMENGNKLLHELFEGKQPNLKCSLYIKNLRKMPRVLQEVQPQELQLNYVCPGLRWSLDWELQLKGVLGRPAAKLPPDFRVGVGDLVVVQLPPEETGMQCQVFMTDCSALARPGLEQVQIQKGKRKGAVVQIITAEKSVHEGEAAGVAPPKTPKPGKKRPMSGVAASRKEVRLPVDHRLVFQAQKEGRCTFLVELSWEHQEELLSTGAFPLPAAEASVGRIGPIQVLVEKRTPQVPELQKAKGALWWAGTRWSPKAPKAKARPRSAMR